MQETAMEKPILRRIRRNDRETPFFGVLPPSLMNAFVKSHRLVHEDVLVTLAKDVFSDGRVDIGPHEVISVIRNVIEARHPNFSTGYDDDASLTDINKPRYVYAKLKEWGWLNERGRGKDTRVEFQPNARLLLNFLIDMRDGMTKSWGGAVLTIETLLKAAEDDPKYKFEGIRTASQNARNFLHHLRSMSSMLAEIEREIIDARDPVSMVGSFFEAFVGKHLIADYAKLQSKTNPFHYRDNIILQCERILRNVDLLDALGDAYKDDDRAISREEGISMINKEIGLIVSAFENVDDTLDMISQAGIRIEERFVNMMRLRDRYDDDRVEDLIGFMRVMLTSGDLLEKATIVTDMPVPGKVLAAERNLRTREAKQRTRQRIVRRPPSAETLEYIRRNALYRDLVEVDETRVLEFLDRRMKGKKSASLDDMRPQDFKEAFTVWYLAKVFVSQGEKPLGGRYRFKFLDSRSVNDWLDLTNIEVERMHVVGKGE